MKVKLNLLLLLGSIVIACVQTASAKSYNRFIEKEQARFAQWARQEAQEAQRRLRIQEAYEYRRSLAFRTVTEEHRRSLLRNNAHVEPTG